MKIAHRRLLSGLVAAAIASLASPALGAELPTATRTGIVLDASWKQKLYSFAQEKLRHPAWGWTHSERDYRLALSIAEKEKLPVDKDVLFAAAFIHDIGAIGEYQKEGVDHSVRSVELAGPILTEMGFPAGKIAAVNDAILTHMFDKVPGTSAAAVALHDADTIDFLGTVGVVRRISVTGAAPDYSAGLAKLRDLPGKLPPSLVTRTAKEMAVPRVAEMKRLLFELDAETAEGRLP
jgi:uncharacterized protein